MYMYTTLHLQKYPHSTIDWEKKFNWYQTTSQSKLKQFQLKMLIHIVFTNEKLFSFGMVESLSCAFSQAEVESDIHFSLSWLWDYNIFVEELQEGDKIFGTFDILLINQTWFLGKVLQ